jgi:hypothetical protein
VVRERKMLSDFLAMMDAAGRQPPSGNTRGDNRFFVPGQPVVFGSYMYLEIGAVLSSSRAGAAALDAFSQVRESRSLPTRTLTGESPLPIVSTGDRREPLRAPT